MSHSDSDAPADAAPDGSPDKPADTPENRAIDRIDFFGVWGGHGTTTVAIAAATILGATRTVLLAAHNPGDAAAVLGTPTPDAGEATIVNQAVSLVGLDADVDTDESTLVVVDASVLDGGAKTAPGAARSLVIGVMRGPCYLALRTLCGADTSGWAGLVLLAEAGRALDRRDVEEITGLPVLAAIDVTPAVARTIDAGLTPSRLPKMREFGELRRCLANLVSGPVAAPNRALAHACRNRSEPCESTCTEWHLPPMAKGATGLP